MFYTSNREQIENLMEKNKKFSLEYLDGYMNNVILYVKETKTNKRGNFVVNTISSDIDEQIDKKLKDLYLS